MKKVLQNIVISIFSNFYTLFGSYIKKGKGAASLKKVKNKLSFIGSGVRFNGTVTITAPGSTAIGNNVHIGDNAFLRTEGGLEIGDNTHISRNITIYTQNHQYQGAVLPFDKDSIKKPVVIGKNVWIGMNVSILPGVTIGDGAIIGLGTVVIKDIEPLSIVGHPTPNFIKSRDGDHYNRLENDKAYGAVGGKKLSKEAIANYKAWPNGK